MRLNRLFHRRSLTIVLVLVLSLLGFVPPLAHAATYVGYTSSNLGGSTCGGNCLGNVASTRGFGTALKAPIAGTLSSVFLFTGSSVPNQVVIATFPTGTPASTGF